MRADLPECPCPIGPGCCALLPDQFYAVGHLVSQSRDSRPPYGVPSRFETIPSAPISWIRAKQLRAATDDVVAIDDPIAAGFLERLDELRAETVAPARQFDDLGRQ